MYTTAMISGTAADGYSSGDAIKAIQGAADNILPSGYTYEWSGMSREEIKSGNRIIYVFLLCSVFVYLLLAA